MKKKNAGSKKTSKTRKPNYLEDFRQLPPLEKSMMEALSIVYDYTSKTNFVNCLRKLHISTPKGKAFIGKTIEPYIDELANAGLVEKEGIHFRCSRNAVDSIARDIVEQGRIEAFADAVRSGYKLVRDGYGNFVARDYDHLINEIRMALYEKNAYRVRQLLSNHRERYLGDFSKRHPYVFIFRNYSGVKWLLEYLPEDLSVGVSTTLLDYYASYLSPAAGEVFAILQKKVKKVRDKDILEPAGTQMAWWKMLAGQFDEAAVHISGLNDMEALLLKGFASFVKGRTDEAISFYENAFEALKKTTRKRKIYFKHPAGLFFILALIQRGNPDDLFRASGYCSVAACDIENPFETGYLFLEMLVKSRNADPDAIGSLGSESPLSEYHPALTILLQAMCVLWTSPRGGVKFKTSLEKLHAKAQKSGAAWLEAEAADLCSRIDKSAKTFQNQAAAFQKKTGVAPLADTLRRSATWERVLDAMIALKKGPADASGKKVENTSRMVWLFKLNEKSGHWEVSPREQKRNPKGVWSKGRKIALKRFLYELETFDYLTSQDIEICRHVEEDSYVWRGYTETSYYFDDKTPLALAGHPLVFWENSPTTPVEIVKGDPELLVGKATGGKIEMSFPLDLDTKHNLQLIKEGPNRIKVVEVSEDLLKIAKLVGNGVKIPANAKDRVLEAVNSVSSIVTVHAEIEGAGLDAEKTQSDALPNIHLLPLDQGLRVEFFCRPFSSVGPYFRPGKGGETVITDIDGQTMRARRDLEKEKRLAEEALSACPTLLSFQESSDGDWSLRLPGPEDCLEALSELRELGEKAAVAWPEGEYYRIRGKADMNHFFLGVKKSRDWFSVSGQLKIDDNLVLDLKQLLELMEHSPGRFIRLGDGQFVALTRSFKKRLEEIEAWSRPSGDNRRFHPLAALALHDLSDELGGLKGDKDWKDHLKKLDDARKLDPKLPSTFKGSLREYQEEGFRWLARLSHWGTGACLADDMGLGKTIQALAAILNNAPNGPSMVVAPTSVRMNWKDEAARFAPTLNVLEFGGANRKDMIDNLGPFDLLLVTYGLLQQKKTAEMLSSVNFATIVLDEAQAIKNFSTQRSKAAMELQGGFKLITTGTPLENHLGELWNLFRFINPGLLGSLKEFNEKFAVPVEKYRDRNARQSLKKLVQPFMLRRSKNQVLEELPPRTDIVLRVEPSKEQMAFYEALRQRALEKLDESGADESGTPKHLQILAEIMRLRRACCHPKLVHPDVSMGSAKLDAFAELAEELLQNGHKALVFSQFVGHLEIIREYLDEQGISHQYLDGSTPAKEREKRVKAFQAGEGEMFLISLKAGGTGLNLTAADFVIHMDPWWNPAVEDQASDRAHRIGQTRPRDRLPTRGQGHHRGEDPSPPQRKTRPGRQPPGRRRHERQGFGGGIASVDPGASVRSHNRRVESGGLGLNSGRKDRCFSFVFVRVGPCCHNWPNL